MPVSKKRKHVRKSEKQLTMVDFETPIFDGTFTLPSPKHMPIGVAAAVQKGDVSEIFAWLEKAGVDEEDLDAFRSLEGEEVQDFMTAWTDGETSVPKS
ncbi:hypothetical protein [Kocuria sp.]|uniref:hypothetical protein n=1 Tax=Kocuria sp. TaxID=1871328 RepID=UPI0026DD7636|nr:hypothetical protein [Kocuria sp.]MDO4919947.1 hypothetical protein [Kocuria sp.]